MKKISVLLVLVLIVSVLYLSLVSASWFSDIIGKITGFATRYQPYNITCVYSGTQIEGPNKTQVDSYNKADLNLYNSKTGKYQNKKNSSDSCQRKKINRVYQNYTKEAYCVKKINSKGERRDQIKYQTSKEYDLCKFGCTNGTCKIQNNCNLNLQPLIENNNRFSDRINLIFIGKDYTDINKFKEYLERKLTLNGEPIIIRDEFAENQPITGLAFGLFSIEPFKSNQNKFNLWYVNEQISGNPDDFKSQINNQCNNFDLNFTSIVLVFNPLEEPQSIAYPSNNNGLIAKKDLVFGITTIYQYPDVDESIDVFAHELGHSLFNLRDEYAKPSEAYSPRYGFNCANNLTDAQTKWGNQIGEIDPFYYFWKSKMIENGLWNIGNAKNETDIQIDYIHGGCYAPADSTLTIRPNRWSLMNAEDIFSNGQAITHPPVFGSVNRAVIEQVLNLFSGV